VNEGESIVHTRLIEKLEHKEQRMIEIRRYLHENPELSYKEYNTAEYITNFYKDMDVSVETNIGGLGIKVTIDSGIPGRTIGIRADFDALAIQEETGLPFASNNPGVMHACGHDAHTAYLLVLAETLYELKDTLKGKIVIIHQPAEEVPPGGALAMINDNILDEIDHMIGLHVISDLEAGKVYYRPGYTQTGSAAFKLTIQGRGGHGSSPHTANDAIVAASYYVNALQTIVSRRLSPFETGVVTIGSFEGQGQFNVIKDRVMIEGDVRGLTDTTKKKIEAEIKRITYGLEVMYGVQCHLDYLDDYPALYNDPELTEAVARSIRTHLQDIPIELTEPQPSSEDFAYYAKERPSAFIYVGAAPVNGEVYPHHHPKFNIDESALLIAAKSVGVAVLDYLEA